MRELFAWGLLLIGGSADAQLVRPNARMIDARSGLSHDQVNAMARDKRGQMWFGTSDGLSRFDGKHVKVYGTSARSCALPNDHINALATDGSGMLYIGSQSPWLTVIDPLADTLANYPLPSVASNDVSTREITAIRVDGRQRIWIGHGRRNLSLFDQRSHTFRSVVIETPNSHPQGRNWIRKITEDRDGFLWLACEFGLVRFDPRDFTYVHYPTDRSSLTAYQLAIAAVLDEGRTLLVGTFNEGLLRFDKRTGSFTHIGTYDRLDVMDMIAVDSGRVWMASPSRGLLAFDPRSGSIAAFDRNLSHSLSRERSDFLPGAQCFFTDPEGSIWIGTGQSGVALIAQRNNRFQLFGLPLDGNGLAASDVMRVAVHPAAKEWLVLTLQKGLYALDSTGTASWHIPSPWAIGSPAMFQDLLVARDGTIWVCTSRELFIVDRRAKRFTRAPQMRPGSPFAQGVRALWTDGDHGLWGDISGHGLMHLDMVNGEVLSIEDHAPGIAKHLQTQVRDLVIDAQGRMWIAMSSKPPVVIWPDGHFTVWKDATAEEDGLPSVFLTTLCEGSDGTMWAGTWANGLIGMRLGANGSMEHQHSTTSQGLPSNTIYGLVRAHDDAIWGTGKSGLFRIDPSTGDVLHFNMNDGLPTPEIYMTFDISPDGRRVFGGLYGGLLTFQVDDLRPEFHAPTVQVPLVQIPLITVFDSAVAVNADLRGGLLTLPHYRSDLRFVLRSTNMVDPFNDTYAYRLHPDTGWTTAPAQDAIIFSQIAPGEHAFEVKARTGVGPWGPISNVPFTILSPWWGTWWFRALLLLLVCALLYMGFRAYLYVRLRRQRTAHEREQAVMRERIRIASDMHDDLGSGLSVIKVKSEIALLTESDPQRVTELKEIARGSGELIDNMRQIVWTLGSGQESLADLVAYMRNYAGKYLDPHGITCFFNADETLPELTLTAIERRNLLLVMKEALHNVVKHAKATEVRIAIRWDVGLRLTITDNGRGIDPESPTTYGMGMNTMRARVKQLNGTMEVANHHGSKLLFHIPSLGSAERSIARR